jgi:hypothetical protein
MSTLQSTAVGIVRGTRLRKKSNGKIYAALGPPSTWNWEGCRFSVGDLIVDYQALNPKTGQPWQRIRTDRVSDMEVLS